MEKIDVFFLVIPFQIGNAIVYYSVVLKQYLTSVMLLTWIYKNLVCINLKNSEPWIKSIQGDSPHSLFLLQENLYILQFSSSIECQQQQI